MGFLEDFQASVEALPAMLHRNYSLMRELDKSLQAPSHGSATRRQPTRCTWLRCACVRGRQHDGVGGVASCGGVAARWEAATRQGWIWRTVVTTRDRERGGVQTENEQRCQQEIEDIKHGLESGSITYDPAKVKFSDEAIEEQKHCVRIADEKVALATQTYDLVDAHIQQLDQFMRKLEELRQEKEAAAAAAAASAAASTTVAATVTANAGTSAADNTPKSGRSGERGRGGRKKTAKVPTVQPAIDLELPVDPNEPTYCHCNQVSYGEMVACDNTDCKIEWFHFGCVGLKEQPKGKWYCPSCIGFQKKRKGK